MTQTHIKFLGGIDTIGGNVVCIRYDNYQIITDFGAVAGASIEDQLDMQITSRLLGANLLPIADGVYDEESLGEINNLLSVQDSEFETIICLSHLHIDHLGSLKHISREIPIYSLIDSAIFYNMLVDSGFLPDYDIEIEGCESGEEIEFGPFIIKFYESDHDTLGASCIFIETPDMHILHSGDLRLSGYHPERVLRWALEAREWNVNMLLMEGTSFSFVDQPVNLVDLRIDKITKSIDSQTEMALLMKVEELLEIHNDLLFAFNGYPQNVERLIRIIELANNTGRQMIVQEDMWELIYPFIKERHQIIIYQPEIKHQIIDHPEDFFIQVDEDSIELIFELPCGSYLHSNGTPLGSFMEGYEEFVKMIVNNGWNYYHANVSGHAIQEDLLMLIQAINPKCVIPWHTFNPEYYAEAILKRGYATFIPEYRIEYAVINDILES